MRAARQFTAVGKPIHSRGSLITTDNGDLACDDVAGRVLERLTPQTWSPGPIQLCDDRTHWKVFS